jgi:head-tail adaptor
MAYNDKIIIQQYTQSRDTLGAIDAGSWGTYKTVWAEIDDTGGNVTDESEMPVYGYSTTFTIRTVDAPAVTTKMRISWSSEIFYIRSIHKEGRLRTVLTADAYDDE